MSESERPTKLAIPQGADMGAEMSPMPPIESEPMGQDPMMGGGEPPMDEPPMDDSAAQGGEEDELMNIINNLSIEDKAAVTKYAKSMADGNSEQPQDMPMESRNIRRKMVSEFVDDLTKPRKDRKTNREETRINSKMKDRKNNPFVSPF